jgi:tartrate dehydratase beta subunit/fumarate hydratase class I family protein
MEAIWRNEVVDLPAFIINDDKGHHLLKELNLG